MHLDLPYNLNSKYGPVTCNSDYIFIAGRVEGPAVFIHNWAGQFLQYLPRLKLGLEFMKEIFRMQYIAKENILQLAVGPLESLHVESLHAIKVSNK